MKNKTTVFLDMDGVISDFTAGWCRMYCVSFSNIPYPFPRGLWDYVSWVEENFDIKWEHLAKNCSNVSFWQNLPVLPDALRFFSVLDARYKNVCFLTTPTGDYDSCNRGKDLWLHSHEFIPYTRYMEENYLITLKPGQSKNEFAVTDSILIDDKDKNVQEFIKAGGMGIVVPRPWNNRHFEFHDFEQANKLVEANLRELLGD